MKTPKIEDFKLKAIKLLNGGGAEVEFSHQFSTGNDANTDEIKIRRTLNVHDDLFNLLKKQKPNVLSVDGIKYRMMATALEKMGVDNQKEIGQVTEAMQQEAMQKMEITGIKLSGKEDKQNAVITYKVQAENKKIVGRATALIQLSGNVFGFEQELEEDILTLTDEVYKYIYKDKHSDSAQLTLWADQEEEENTDEPGEED